MIEKLRLSFLLAVLAFLAVAGFLFVVLASKDAPASSAAFNDSSQAAQERAERAREHTESAEEAATMANDAADMAESLRHVFPALSKNSILDGAAQRSCRVTSIHR